MHITERTADIKSDRIHAELIGSDTCTCAGLTAHGNAPVLVLCRRLLEAGHDPAARLEAWRGGALCLIVRSIGEGARLDVDDSGTPRFRRYRSPAEKGLVAAGHSAAGAFSALDPAEVAAP
jgi:hypothetical protein